MFLQVNQNLIIIIVFRENLPQLCSETNTKSMRKYIQSIVYVVSLLGAWYVMRMVAASEENPFSFYENPLMWVLFIGTILIIFMKEILTLEALSKAKEVVSENEQTKYLPWWLFMSYGMIFIGAVYFISNPIVKQESLSQNQVVIPNTSEMKEIDASTAQILTDAASLNKGKAIFNMYCVSCHAKDGGGGVGPNLTDKYWVIGGDMKSVFKTIQEGGRPGRGMLSWKRSIKPEDIEKVASYVLSLQGKRAKSPKAPQGDLWEE